ncbi:MAG: hypothetical protein KGJ62_05405 [Armatimonadetes bacterium]|nr:hypothetical protein [Armatimonadota bacterium]MDE2206641.1 hypothetical protein [Armatimonadota bacterium]
MPQLLRVTLTEPGSRKPVETLLCTRQHPFYVAGKGFVYAGELALGTSIVTRAGPKLVVSRIDVLHRRGGYTVYNLIVDGVHDYFVGQVGGGVEVHNGPCGGSGAAQDKTAFVVTPGGDVIPVPKGANGPFPTRNPGFQYNGGAGGNGLADNVTDVRIMEPSATNPNGYVNYGQRQVPKGWQSVNPYSGKPVWPDNPWWHIPLSPEP